MSDVMWSVLNRERVSRVIFSSAFPMHLPLVEEARSRFVSKYVKHPTIFVVKSSGSRSSAIRRGASARSHVSRHTARGGVLLVPYNDWTAVPRRLCSSCAVMRKPGFLCCVVIMVTLFP